MKHVTSNTLCSLPQGGVLDFLCRLESATGHRGCCLRLCDARFYKLYVLCRICCLLLSYLNTHVPCTMYFWSGHVSHLFKANVDNTWVHVVQANLSRYRYNVLMFVFQFLYVFYLLPHLNMSIFTVFVWCGYMTSKMLFLCSFWQDFLWLKCLSWPHTQSQCQCLFTHLHTCDCC